MEVEVNTVRGVVCALEAGDAIVEVEQGGCGRCHEKGGCGGQQFTQMLCSSRKTYRVANPAGAIVGEKVTIAIAVGALRRSANLAYGLPVLGLIVGAIIGMQILGDFGAMAGGCVGLVAASLLAYRKGSIKAGNQINRPYIVSRHNS